ncbi:MAG: glycosyltransferase [Candidatus Bathyarchaeota archaeon]|nr:glycosyltransferase [Candidatus Bathyarchaeota archaeon]
MEPLVHFMVPFVVLIVLGLSPKRALPLALLALIPDFDALFLVHRSLSHSIFVLAAVFIPLSITAYALKRGMRTCASAFFTLASHVVLDAFSGATPVFWPLYGNAIWVKANLTVHVGGSVNLSPNMALLAEPITFHAFRSLDAPLFTGEGLIVSLMLLAAVSISFIKGWRGAVFTLQANVAAGFNGAADPEGAIQESAVMDDGSILPGHVTVVIPTLNEAKAIGLVLDELRREGYGHVLVVDGYSRDGTDKIAQSKGAKVIYQHGVGKTGALKTAIEHVATPYILVMDGDHTYDPKDIGRLLGHGRFYSLVIGARDRRNISRLHRLGNWIITQTFNILFGTSLSDVCSGMYLLKTEFAKRIDLASRGFSTEVEVAAQAAVEQSITEVPIGYRARIGRRKLATWRHGFAILSSVVGLARRHNPILFLSAIAASTIIPAIAILLWVIYRLAFLGIWHSGWALMGVMLLLFASQSIALGAIAFLLRRIERRIIQRIREEKGEG